MSGKKILDTYLSLWGTFEVVKKFIVNKKKYVCIFAETPL